MIVWTLFNCIGRLKGIVFSLLLFLFISVYMFHIVSLRLHVVSMIFVSKTQRF